MSNAKYYYTLYENMQIYIIKPNTWFSDYKEKHLLKKDSYSIESGMCDQWFFKHFRGALNAMSPRANIIHHSTIPTMC